MEKSCEGQNNSIYMMSHFCAGHNHGGLELWSPSGLLLEALSENLFHAFFLVSELPASLGVPWVIDASLQSLPPSSHGIIPV